MDGRIMGLNAVARFSALVAFVLNAFAGVSTLFNWAQDILTSPHSQFQVWFLSLSLSLKNYDWLCGCGSGCFRIFLFGFVSPSQISFVSPSNGKGEKA